jgi:hypothetical protein
MEVTLLGIVMLVKALKCPAADSSNAWLPMEVTVAFSPGNLEGIVTAPPGPV